MPPSSKLSPAVIAALFDSKRKVSQPDSSSSAGSPESHFTPFEEILAERAGFRFPTGIHNAARAAVELNEILASEKLPPTDPNRMFAVGAYQITFPVLKEAVRKMGLTGNELMTPATQDRIFANFLLRRDLGRYLKDPKVGVDQAQYSAARQWASIAVPKNYGTRNSVISDGTMTYYDDKPSRGYKPANKASTPATQELRRILENWHRPWKSASSVPLGIGR